MLSLVDPVIFCDIINVSHHRSKISQLGTGVDDVHEACSHVLGVQAKALCSPGIQLD